MAAEKERRKRSGGKRSDRQIRIRVESTSRCLPPVPGWTAFARLVREHVGLRPKLYVRIVRMESTRAAARSPCASQVELAVRGGYPNVPTLSTKEIIMKLDKLTTVLVVDRIEPCLPPWEKLGYTVAVRVPEQGTADFVLLQSSAGGLMFQTRASLAGDVPAIAERRPTFLLYADVASVAEARKAFPDAKILVNERKTFYGATESWLEIEGGIFLALAEHSH
jgi:hypothetical protein